jgi:hypothetical protein
MKSTVVKALALAALFLAAASAYAANTITLQNPAMLNGKQLAAGEYQVKISGTGTVADVTFLRGGTEVVTAKATLKDLDKKASYDAVVTKGGDGSSLPSITEIQFGRKKQVLVFDGSAQASNDGSSGGRQ